MSLGGETHKATAIASDHSSSARGAAARGGRGGRGGGRGRGRRGGGNRSAEDATSSSAAAPSSSSDPTSAAAGSHGGARGGGGGGRSSGRGRSGGREASSSRGGGDDSSSYRGGGGRRGGGRGGRGRGRGRGGGRGRSSDATEEQHHTETNKNEQPTAVESAGNHHPREHNHNETVANNNNNNKEEEKTGRNKPQDRSARGGGGRNPRSHGSGGGGRSHPRGGHNNKHRSDDHPAADDQSKDTNISEATTAVTKNRSDTTRPPRSTSPYAARGRGGPRGSGGRVGGGRGRGRSRGRGGGGRGGRGSGRGRFHKRDADGEGSVTSSRPEEEHEEEDHDVTLEGDTTAADLLDEEFRQQEQDDEDHNKEEHDHDDEEEDEPAPPDHDDEEEEERENPNPVAEEHEADKPETTEQEMVETPSLVDEPTEQEHDNMEEAVVPHDTTAAKEEVPDMEENGKQQKTVLSLPALPPNKHNGGKLMILSRSTAAARVPSDAEPAANEEEESAPAAAHEEPQQQQQHPKPPHAKKKKPKKKTKKPVPTEEEGEQLPEVQPLTTTEALRALPSQEVSITADTSIMFRTPNDAAATTTTKPGTPLENSQGLAGRGASTTSDKLKNTKKAKAKKGKKKGLGNDTEANRKAVQQFNRLVNQCVMQSDPDGMREILHDTRNHNFALDALVLETVMKAYIMAAMFDEALYCLRHCTLPGTLQTIQTEHVLSCLPQNLRNSSAYTAADMINALCIATDFDTPTSRTYFLRIVRGIALEFLEEATSARDRICSSPCERLVRAGLCVVNAHLKRGKKPADLVVVPGDQLGVFVSDTSENRGIQAGDAVSILPYAGPYPMSAESLDRNMIEATVTNTNPMVLRLQDKANASLYAMLVEPLDGNVYRIDKLANRMGFNRQLAAAVAIASPLGDPPVRDPRRPSPELVRAITAMDENIDLVMRASQGGKLPRKELTSTAALCSQAIPWNADDESEGMDQDAIRSECRLTLEKYGALEGLNPSQMLGVEGATSNRLTLVQGPPGTGKTVVAIRILQHWARLTSASVTKGETPPPILATSDSNIAVDNLVEGCAAVGLRVIRLGRPEAIRPELLRFCIDRPPSSYGNESSGGSGGNSGPSPAAHRERVKQMRADIKNAQVICCTCIGSGGDILDGMTFDRVLVDEATQATEPAVLVPLMRGCRQLVLVGDHCQLPPTVLSTRAEEEGHGVPLFSRMVACGVAPYMLDTQFRMHPRIAMFPSDLFYGGLLKNGVSAPERRPLAGFPWPVEEFPVAFIPIKGQEMDDGVSKYNEAEAEAACNAVAMLMNGGQCLVSDIAVVTPYAAQARLIRRMTRKLQENTGPPFIEVSSVDGFQGREKEAVVFSAVRSNDYGAIGFTSDWRRVNVSFTRARRALIVIGNDATLRRGDPDTWGPWLAWADAHGLNMDKPGVPRGRYDPEQLRRVRGGTTAAEMLKDVLARQHAQLKSAEKQQERAVKNAMGHIRATAEAHEDEEGGGEKTLSLEQDLAQMENADGHWDDSDEEEEGKLNHSTSKTTLTSHSSHDHNGDPNAVVDVWDL